MDLPVADNVEERLYKVLVIGEFGVGKTSIIRRYTENFFSPNYKLTIGVDFALKPLEWQNPPCKINLQLWDIAGHERFGQMTRVYYKYAIAAVLVYDTTRSATFDAVLKWYSDVNSKVMLSDEKPVPCLLLANKCDLDEAQVDKETLDAFCHKHGFIGWFATSAKDDTNISDAFEFLVSKILEMTAMPSQPDRSAVHLDDGQDSERSLVREWKDRCCE
ncbi:ras-related protein Rab-32B-like [Sycon ciliatum]|uniref:ras-related protein Rab-32B-like n=1 Tax=Sycon ciliatum TaxID=27933 RepID=UPI0020A94611|eukprot:scpid79062/ scgid26260/ Ras-related protein Rab-32B